MSVKGREPKFAYGWKAVLSSEQLCCRPVAAHRRRNRKPIDIGLDVSGIARGHILDIKKVLRQFLSAIVESLPANARRLEYLKTIVVDAVSRRMPDGERFPFVKPEPDAIGQ